MRWKQNLAPPRSLEVPAFLPLSFKIRWESRALYPEPCIRCHWIFHGAPTPSFRSFSSINSSKFVSIRNVKTFETITRGGGGDPVIFLPFLFDTNEFHLKIWRYLTRWEYYVHSISSVSSNSLYSWGFMAEWWDKRKAFLISILKMTIQMKIHVRFGC